MLIYGKQEPDWQEARQQGDRLLVKLGRGDGMEMRNTETNENKIYKVALLGVQPERGLVE